MLVFSVTMCDYCFWFFSSLSQQLHSSKDPSLLLLVEIHISYCHDVKSHQSLNDSLSTSMQLSGCKCSICTRGLITCSVTLVFFLTLSLSLVPLLSSQFRLEISVIFYSFLSFVPFVQSDCQLLSTWVSISLRDKSLSLHYLPTVLPCSSTITAHLVIHSL